MGQDSLIEWCHHTFNGWIGCAKVSDGCKFCFAEVDHPARISRSRGVELWGPRASRRVTSEDYWRKPLAWDRAARAAGERHRVFAFSQADWLEDREDLDEPRLRLLGLIERTKSLDWLLLSKRIENWGPLLRRAMARVPGGCGAFDGALMLGADWLAGRPPANVWLMASVENQRYADERIPRLLATPAAVRGLSVEPLLGPVDVSRVDLGIRQTDGYGPMRVYWDALTGWEHQCQPGVVIGPADFGRLARSQRCPRIDWVIVGGESGPGARPCDVRWIRSIVEQCRAAGVPCFVKQFGAHVVCRNDEVADWFGECGHLDLSPTERFQGAVGRVRGLDDKKGGDPAEWPSDLRVREFPAGRR